MTKKEQEKFIECLELMQGEEGLEFDNLHFTWYPALRANKDLNVANTERKDGKTNANYCLINYNGKKYGGKTSFIRRSQTEAFEAADSFLDELSKFRIYAKIADYIKIKNKKSRKELIFFYNDENGDYHEVVLGYFLDLKTACRKKSIAYNCNFIIFDEFLPEDRKFLENEDVKFASLLNTIMRDITRPNKVFLTSNVGSYVNPYYTMFDIHVKDGEFTGKTKDGSISFWMEIGGKNPLLKDIDAESLGDRITRQTSYAKIAIDNKFIDSTAAVEKVKDFKIKPSFTVYVEDNKAFTVSYIKQGEGYCAMYIEKKRDTLPKNKIISCNIETALKKDIKYHNKKSSFFSTIKTNIENGNVVFETLELKYLLFELLEL